MSGIDDAIAELGGGGVLLALLAAAVLGLRHATDPDHLTAVSSLVLSPEPRQARRASWLGLCWGLGHATTLLAIGLQLVLLEHDLPPAIERGAELTVGLVIAALAVRLLVCWRRGYLHAHPHEHDGVRHAHPHVHEHPRGEEHPDTHVHSHAEASTAPGWSPTGSAWCTAWAARRASGSCSSAASQAVPPPRSRCCCSPAPRRSRWRSRRAGSATRSRSGPPPAQSSPHSPARHPSLLFGAWYATAALAA